MTGKGPAISKRPKRPLHVIPAPGALLDQHPKLDAEIVMDDRPIDPFDVA
ncbi:MULTISPECIES: hypothetical protein [unclassified Caballeronia]|nr:MULTISPECIES: hypothetical protein [unclassified Caballeronia]